MIRRRSAQAPVRRRRYRVFVLPATGLAVVLAGLLVFGNLNESLVYYLEPTEMIERRAELADGQRLRLGGEVVAGSVSETADGVRFTLGDGRATVPVVHRGSASQLFQEDIWVVIEGSWSDEVFASDTLMVMHDEVYKPPADGYRPPPDGDPPAVEDAAVTVEGADP